MLHRDLRIDLRATRFDILSDWTNGLFEIGRSSDDELRSFALDRLDRLRLGHLLLASVFEEEENTEESVDEDWVDRETTAFSLVEVEESICAREECLTTDTHIRACSPTWPA